MSKPLYSFDNANDYIFDVKWSPIHPAVFASVDAMGKIDVWNINTDTEVCSPFIIIVLQETYCLKLILVFRFVHKIFH